MKLSSMFKKAVIAVVFLLTTPVAQAGAPPPPGPLFNFVAEVTTPGPFFGEMGIGFFVIDETFLVGGPVTLGPFGGPFGGLLEFELTLLV